MATSKRGPKQNNRKNFAAREAYLKYRKERNARILRSKLPKTSSEPITEHIYGNHYI